MNKKIFGVLSCVLALSGSLAPLSLSGQEGLKDDFLPSESSSIEKLATETSKSISSRDDLIKIITDKGDASYNSFKLAGDIDCSGMAESVFNNYSGDSYFSGTFDGNGHTLKNIPLASNNGFYGLFPYAKNLNIKNLKIEAPSITFSSEYEGGNIYAGILVGYGENVVFENCEIILKDNEQTQTILLTNIEENAGKSASEKTLNDNISFGILAGYLDNGGVETSSNGASIKNCIVGANIKLTQTEDKFINLGGMIGVLKNGSISHSIYSGNIECYGEGTLSKNIGGIVGRGDGNNTRIRNVCFDGQLTGSQIGVASFGNILGGKNDSIPPEDSNFNYCYWTSLNNKGIGESDYEKTTFINTSSISQDFLTQKDNFDPTMPDWDFGRTWSSKEGQISLQNFMTFKISVNEIVDALGLFEAETNKSNPLSYEEEIVITLKFKEPEHQKWYELESVLLNGSTANDNCTKEKTSDGYKITIQASALTEGIYSFRAKALKYTGEVIALVEDEEGATDFGGVKIKGAQSTSLSLSLDFSYAIQTRIVEAVSQGKYIFSGYKLYYKNGDDWQEQTSAGNLSDPSNSKLASITYTPNEGKYGQEFRLVALFTKDVKTIKVGLYEKNHIKSIKVNGEEIGEGVEVASNSSQVTIDIVTKSAEIDVEKFIQNFNTAFAKGDDSAIVKVGEQENQELEEIAYSFKVDMTLLDKNKLEENSLPLSFSTTKVRMGASKNIIWLWITLPIVGLLVIVGIIIIILKKRGGGHGRRKTTKKAPQEKKASYKDYYI